MIWRKMTYALLALAMAAGNLAAQQAGVAAKVDSLEARIDSLSAVHDSLTQQRGRMLVRSSALSAHVDRLRGPAGQTLGPLVKYRLNSALAQGQLLADSLDLINWRLDDLEQELDGLRLDAVAACTAALDSLSLLMKDTQAVPGSALARQFDMLRERRQVLAAVAGGEQEHQRRPDNARLTMQSLAGLVRIAPGDSPEEVAEKSAFLTEIEDRWGRALEALERNIGMLGEEREMRSRLGEFTQELALFDETGPSNRARTVSSDGAAGDQSREGVTTPKQSFMDYATNDVSSQQMAESIALDIQLNDPEIELRLMQSMDRFSSGDIVDLMSLLEARRDSLALDLKNLKQLHKQMKREAGLD